MGEELQIDFGYSCERDIDMFHAYSFSIDEDYLSLFTDKLDWNILDPKITSIEISKTDISLGESDVTICFTSEGKKYGILIEDKIDAEAQPDQCARYYLRGEEGVKNGDYDAFAVFICAPEKYLSFDQEAAKYENQISFQDIEEYLANKDDVFSKLRLMEIKYILYHPKSRYQGEPDENATALWLSYIDYVHEHYPDLDLYDKQRWKPKGGSWIEYKTPHKQLKLRLFHKTNFGTIHLEFSGLADKAEEIEQIIADQIDDYKDQGYEIVVTGKSASLQKDFGKAGIVDYDQSFSSQYEIIKEQIEWINKINTIAANLDVEAIKALRS